MVTKIGIDLGYANITLSNVVADIYREPSVILMDKDTRRILSIGAKAAYGEEPEANGILVRPFKNGMLYSSDLTAEIIANIVRAVKPAEKIRCVFGTPSDMIAKQESEIHTMLTSAGVDEVLFVKRPIAALVGAGYAPTISAVSVNIGASSTEIAVIHNGKIISLAREQVGGEDFDKAIKDHILEQGEMNVSILVARTIKERLGAVWQGRPSESIDIEGTLSLTGNRIKMSISTEDVVGVFEAPLQKLLYAIAASVKKIPIDYVKDIFENGIILTGGGAELFGIETMIEKVLGVSVTKSESPIDSVAKGLSRIHSFIPQKHSSNGKNISDKLAKFYELKKNNNK